MKKLKNTIQIVSSRRKAALDRSWQQPFVATVEGLSDTGAAIVRHPEGLVVFVPGLWLGERARIQILTVKKSYAQGRVLEVLEPAAERIGPVCSLHGFTPSACGGCPWMFVSYDAQLQAKQVRVQQMLQPIEPTLSVNSIIPSPQTLNYRVRAQLKTDGKRLGFMAHGNNNIVTVLQCPVLDAECNKKVRQLTNKLPNKDWQPKRSQKWNTLDIQKEGSDCLVSLNRRLPFMQVNSQQNHAMLQWLARIVARFDPHVKIVELFAGSGNLTEVLVERGFNNIVAVEVIDEAVDALNHRGWTGVKAVRCDLFKQQEMDHLSREHQDAQVMVLDPPRDGLKEHGQFFSAQSQIQDIVYISCDLATLKRDVQMMVSQGYSIEEVQPLDMFPQTPHVETLVYLQRKK